MKKFSKLCVYLFFVFIALPRMVVASIRKELHVSYLRWRHPQARFAPDCYVDDECSFEEGVRICDGARAIHSSVGMFSYLASDSSVQHCTIGRYCSIGPEARIGLGVHPLQGMISTCPAFYSRRSHAINFRQDPNVREYLPIVIRNDVWIGARAMILDGVTIGDGAIIAAGSVVTKDVEPYTIVGGVPARLIRRRFSEAESRTLVDFAWWNRGKEFCSTHAELFANAPAFLDMVARENQATHVSAPEMGLAHSG